MNRVTLNDIDQLQKIGKKTFNETFALENTAENMKRYLDEGFSIEKLTAELTNKNSEFYFAALENHIIGYMKLKLKDNSHE